MNERASPHVEVVSEVLLDRGPVSDLLSIDAVVRWSQSDTVTYRARVFGRDDKRKDSMKSAQQMAAMVGEVALMYWCTFEVCSCLEVHRCCVCKFCLVCSLDVRLHGKLHEMVETRGLIMNIYFTFCCLNDLQNPLHFSQVQAPIPTLFHSPIVVIA